MTGISGSISYTTTPAEGEAVSLLSSGEVLLQASGTSTGYIHDERFSAAIAGTLILPSGNTDARQLVFINELYDGLLCDPSAFLSDCEGAFVVAWSFHEKKELHIASDPFGNVALYFGKNEREFYFSTSQKHVSRYFNTTSSERAILSYIRIGFPLNTDTFFNGVERLPTASILTVTSQGTITTRRYFYPKYSRIEGASIDKAIDAIIESLSHSLRKALDHTPSAGIALTGGFDSRTTLAILRSIGKEKAVEFYTHGSPQSYDLLIASEIAARFGLRHRVHIFSEQDIERSVGLFDQIISGSEGGFGLEAVLTLNSWEFQRTLFSTIFDSHGGQIYRRTILKARAHAIEKLHSVAEGVLRHIISPLFHSQYILAPIQTQAKEITHSALNRYFSTVSNLQIGDQIDRFFIDQICNNRNSATGNLALEYLPFIHPLLTTKASEILSGIPIQFRAKNGVYRAIIDRLAPELATFPLENNGFKIPYRGYEWKRYIPQVYDKLLRKAGVSVHKRLTLQRPITSAELVIAKGREKASTLLLENLPYLKNHANTEKLEEALAKQKPIHSGELIAVTNMALLLKYLHE